MPRVLFIGLDSADPSLIKKWCRSGVLPNLNALMRRSRRMAVTTPVGFANRVFWSSFYTAANPADTAGYFSQQIEPGSYRISKFIEDRDFRREPIWKMASQAGQRVAVIDMVRGPLTPEINGIQVADWLSHEPTDLPRSWPRDLIGQITRKYGGDPMSGKSSAVFATTTDEGAFFRQVRDRIKIKTDMSLDYLKRGDWDLFMTVFTDSHDVGHLCWHMHDPTHPRHDATRFARLGDPIEDTYKSLDEAVGRLVGATGDDTTIVLLIGPGMGPNYTGNQMLDRFLHRLEASKPAERKRVLPMLRTKYSDFVPIGIRKRLRRGFGAPIKDRILESERRHRPSFAIPHPGNSGAIRINLIGREPSGIVKPGQEYDDYCDWLRGSLLELVNADTGQPVVDEVVRVDREYSGENIEHLPDLLVVWSRDSEITKVRSPVTGEIRARHDEPWSGDHTPHGLFLVSGPGIEAGVAEVTPTVMDIGATLCSMLGVSLPKGDGRPIRGLTRPA